LETQVRTPQMVFMQPQRLIVPLFQRPYVWNQENQWEPLWNDVVRVAERLLNRPHDKHYAHFLGAVVLQQVQRPTGLMQVRTIIDGQQRLTTLQLLLDALHSELLSAEALPPAMRIEPLVVNAEPFCSKPEDRFKVWPTNRDRSAFNAIMGARPPVNHDAVGHRGERMVEAHRFFSEQARQWLLLNGPDAVGTRGVAIENVVRELLQMVVIDLAADENAQEIFETLNARGAQLTAADLIKNFVFQRLFESGADVESAYEHNWKEFETGFWETEISVGRLRYPRSSIFLNHWLIARTGDEVVAREIFSRFKTFADFDAGRPMTVLLDQVHSAAAVYRQFIIGASTLAGSIDRLGLFGYRTGVLESEVIKPLVLYLLDPEEPAISGEQLTKALEVVESWMVRRMLSRATTKSYSQVVAELITQLGKSGRMQAGDVIESYLAGQTSESRYWPDDEEIRGELRELLAYRRLGRGRLRMMLEAIEDHKRGWKDGKPGLGGERVARGKYAIEHVMPRRWATHWKLPNGSRGEAERDRLIHTIGNLMLLTGKLNSKVSNAAWLGDGGKRAGLEGHDVLLLNRELLRKAREAWTDEAIRDRTEELASLIVEIWPVPEGHRSRFTHEKARARRKVDLSDLISAGLLVPGMTLFPRRKRFAGRVATLLPDGRVDVDGSTFATPAGAAASMTGKPTHGMSFFLVDQASRRTLKDVWRDYIEGLAVDVEEDEAEDDGEEDEG
jgi:Protein of unknown function DUF262/Protein of unknown function (DUF1524)/Restriction Enzyme Adenine Methylase Associated